MIRRSGYIIAFALMVLLTTSPAVRADDGDGEKNLFMGIVTQVAADHIVARPAGKDGEERTLRITPETKFDFVGFQGIGKPTDKPGVGFAFKASLAKGDVAKSILFSPNYPSRKSPENRHKMKPEELFKATDLNSNGNVDFVEYGSVIFQSYKHYPDRFRKKLDQNHDDVLDFKEFANSLELLEWWRLSRKTTEDWVKASDKNSNGQLEQEELRALIGDAHGKLEQLFAKLDKDKSNGLSAKELQAYMNEAIAGKN